MTNVMNTVDGDILTIVIDLSETHGLSASQKSLKIASTGGNVDLPSHPGIKLGINCFSMNTEYDPESAEAKANKAKQVEAAKKLIAKK